MPIARLLRNMVANRREERVGVALRAAGVVLGRNEELVFVLVIAVWIVTATQVA
jgi:hypothetical protein